MLGCIASGIAGGSTGGGSDEVVVGSPLSLLKASDWFVCRKLMSSMSLPEASGTTGDAGAIEVQVEIKRSVTSMNATHKRSIVAKLRQYSSAERVQAY